MNVFYKPTIIKWNISTTKAKKTFQFIWIGRGFFVQKELLMKATQSSYKRMLLIGPLSGVQHTERKKGISSSSFFMQESGGILIFHFLFNNNNNVMKVKLKYFKHTILWEFNFGQAD